MREQPLIFRPGSLLRIEALLVVILAAAAYNHWFPHHWILFASWFLAPDLSLIPYAFGPNATVSVGYNAAHSYSLPLALGTLGLLTGQVVLTEAALIWVSHIGMDRTLGYGLKYPRVFRFTHVQAADMASPSTERSFTNEGREK